jgi:isopenicillin N synthase-like dioxygenase
MKIPHIDISSLFTDKNSDETVNAIGGACRDIGFLSISGTGVSAQNIAKMRSVVRQIFDVPEAQKWAGAITRDSYRGYIPLGFFTPNDGSSNKDNYEGYKLHLETATNARIVQDCSLYGPNIWPENIPDAKSTILSYWAEMDRIVDALLRALAVHLGLDSNVFRDAFVNPMTNMTLLHYPPQDRHDKGYGIHPHKDTDALTIIAPDPIGGLEVQTRDGGWISPECPADGFVVNIGDMLELWSGGRLVSTPHRVVNATGKERYSFPYFAVPRHDVTVSPLLQPVKGFDRPDVNCGLWSAEIWRTNWPDEHATEETPELGTLKN